MIIHSLYLWILFFHFFLSLCVCVSVEKILFSKIRSLSLSLLSIITLSFPFRVFHYPIFTLFVCVSVFYVYIFSNFIVNYCFLFMFHSLHQLENFIFQQSVSILQHSTAIGHLQTVLPDLKILDNENSEILIKKNKQFCLVTYSSVIKFDARIIYIYI